MTDTEKISALEKKIEQMENEIGMLQDAHQSGVFSTSTATIWISAFTIKWSICFQKTFKFISLEAFLRSGQAPGECFATVCGLFTGGHNGPCSASCWTTCNYRT